MISSATQRMVEMEKAEPPIFSAMAPPHQPRLALMHKE